MVLLLKAAPPESPAWLLLLLARLLEFQQCYSFWYTYCMYAQDKYHGCIRNDMMLMMNG
jgi:hypothetical protein